MRHSLKLHPDSRCDAVTGIEVEVLRPQPDALTLQYFVSGKIGALLLPRLRGPSRTDQLWKHTCLEAFVRAGPNEAYYEFNFSPSMQWAAYGFDSYRSGMRAVNEIDSVRVNVSSDGACYQLQVSLELVGLPGLPNGAAWQLGLAAVIEEASGNVSYWALAHPPGKPDFHHADGFALELPSSDPES